MITKLLLLFTSFFLITLAKPVYLPELAPLATAFGYALFFLPTSRLSSKKRFIAGFCFFFLVQATSIWWFLSHPFSYIWGVYLLLCTLFGLQFGLLSFLSSRMLLSHITGALFLASSWTLLEWSRLFWLSGFYFDLVGMHMSANSYSIQTASIFGTLGMSFWVMLTNFLACYAWIHKNKKLPKIIYSLVLIAPFLWGHYRLESLRVQKAHHDVETAPIRALVVCGKSHTEHFEQAKQTNPLDDAFIKWQKTILELAPYKGQKFDFLLFPEVLVPFSSSSLIYPKNKTAELFQNTLDQPVVGTEDSYICSEDIANTISHAFKAPVIIGLEGTQAASRYERQKFFNSAFCFTGSRYPHIRYDKQLLVPMGEYIPFSWAKEIAARYGVFDSFTPGSGPKVFCIGKHRIAPSICYEEIFPNIMRKSAPNAITLFVNMTSGQWFPSTLLAWQHFEHARARTVENGVPLIRACNYGISGAINSLGETVIAKDAEKEDETVVVKVSSFHYKTLYSRYGDLPLLLVATFFVAAYLGGFILLYLVKKVR